MPQWEEWAQVEDEEEEELQDFYEGKRDVILFAIDCSESMHELHDDPIYEDVKSSHVLTALEAAMQIQKKKVIVGPNDAVGIMMFNIARKNEAGGQGADIKQNNFVFQPIDTVNAPKVQELIQLIDAAREDPNLLKETFPPSEKRVPMGDVFTSCNWIMRDGAPKTASKRIFLITDEDDPNPGPGRERLLTSARTTLIDLTQAGIMVEPFFVSTEEKPFDQTRFYSSVLLPNNLNDDERDPSVLPETISITRIDDLLAQMRFHEVPKRALFSIPFELANGFIIGVKGYGLVTEQKRGAYRYFVDTGEKMQVVDTRTQYVFEHGEPETKRIQVLYGMTLGETISSKTEDERTKEPGPSDDLARRVPVHAKAFYTQEEIRSFRTLGLKPTIKLLGFKRRHELRFEDNIKHSIFIYPDEMSYSGSKRTFNALLKTMIRKKRIGLVLALTRSNSSPAFCALLPQAEKVEEGGWNEPAGFQLIPLPFADDIRAAPIETGYRASNDLKAVARKWIDKLSIKNGTYPPDSYPSPALAYHNTQLEASAFREEFDPESFEDLTLPKYTTITKKVGPLLKEWKQTLAKEEAANIVELPSDGKKRKADESVDEKNLRALYSNGELHKLRVDQLKAFCKANALSVSGKKSDLIDRVGEFLDSH